MSVRRALAIVIVAIAAASAAQANATLKRAVPVADAVLQRPPDVLELEFSEAVDMAQVELALTGADGKTASLGEPEAQPRFGTIVLRQINQPLSGGVYTVTWRVLASDGDRTSGGYRFTVKAAK